jgi:hypothetical protein
MVPVSGTEGGSAPREACPKIRQPSHLALFSFIHFPNYSRPLLHSYLNGLSDGADGVGDRTGQGAGRVAGVRMGG